MSANLLLCISQEEILKPYRFKITNINVYSFEEALYHCYYYWKQSTDDFTSDAFILWVGETLKLSFIASKIKDLSLLNVLSRKLAVFLSLTDYFSNEQIETLRREVVAWENRNEWEKLKERGDYLINHDDAEKACYYYKKALDYGENKELLNNLAIAFMKTGNYTKAIGYLNRALKLSPMNYKLMLHIAEAYILNRNFDEASSALKKIQEHYGEQDEIYYFYGEISFAQGNYINAVSYYEKIIANSDMSDPAYIYRLYDVYVKLRFYDKALDVLNKINIKDKYFLKKQADVYVAYNNIPAAIKCIEKALYKNKNSVELWVRLAQYHRLDYDLSKASSAIIKALDLSADNPHANLENARIKKALGKIKDYQVILNRTLTAFKEKYRDNEYDTSY